MARPSTQHAAMWHTVHAYCAAWFTEWRLSDETSAEIMDVIDI
jgi:hypothetical protein